jgi:hypothetical protein
VNLKGLPGCVRRAILDDYRKNKEQFAKRWKSARETPAPGQAGTLGYQLGLAAKPRPKLTVEQRLERLEAQHD